MKKKTQTAVERMQLIYRAINIFRNKQKDAEREAEKYKKSPASLYASGQVKAYGFCADYLKANMKEIIK